MSPHSPPHDDPAGIDSDVLAEWIEETAGRKDMSKQALVDEVLSSYWVLEELSEVVGGDSTEELDPRRGHGSDGGSRPTDAGHSTSDADEGGEDLQRELQELRGVIQQLAMTNAASSTGTQPTHGSERVGILEERLRGYESTLDDHEGMLETHAELLDALSEEVTRVTDALGEKVDESTVDATTDRLESDQEAFADRIDEEFTNIERILRHVLETTDNVEYQLESTADRLGQRIASIEETAEERERLREVKAEAMSAGVSAGACHNCDQRIDLGLLEDPYCPSCDRQLSGIEPGGWLPFQEIADVFREAFGEYQPGV